MKYKLCGILIVNLVLIACGGGSGSGSDTEAIPAEVITTIEQSAPGSTAELLTTESFLLKSTDQLSVDVSVAELANTRAYINICHPAEHGGINYNDCVVNKPFTDGAMQIQLTIGNEVDHLYMEIWSYTVDSEPYRYQWQKNHGMNWVVN